MQLPPIGRAYAALAAVGAAALVLHIEAGVGGRSLFEVWLYNALLVLAVAGCAARVVLVPRERGPWIALTLALAAWEMGEIFYDFVYDGNPPWPSVGDAFYLGYYPFAYVALVLLVRSRISAINRSLWLDGVMAALAASAVGAAVLLQVVISSTEGSFWPVATNLAYPIGDMLLVALVIGVFAVTGWRGDRTWIVLGVGLALTAFADAVYLFQVATGTYVEGTLWDVLWPASYLLLAGAAWVPAGRASRVELRGRPLLAIPAVCAVVAIGVATADRFLHLNAAAGALAAATLVAVLVRAGLTFRENAQLLARARQQAVTDALTGLSNRRALLADLEHALAEAKPERPRLLVLFDLDGFKRYNDTFGHPAGDALLVRLARKLTAALGADGTGYRLGGDEFCVLAAPGGHGIESVIERATSALSEEGDGFAVKSSCGAVVIPQEAVEAVEALRIADGRLYAQKSARAAGRGEPHEVLLQLLLEREPDLHDHVRTVAELAVAIGQRVGLDADELVELRMAAELHDVGKLAIPDSILRKPGELTEEEWTFVRQHTLVGQRILAAAPAMHGVGLIVRSTHERWDGQGYADGLAGDAIPLGARIIAACDAHAAMTAPRPYRQRLTHEEAVAELRRCAGTQFDPGIVAVLCDVLVRRAAEPTAAASAA